MLNNYYTKNYQKILLKNFKIRLIGIILANFKYYQKNLSDNLEIKLYGVKSYIHKKYQQI